MSAPNVVVIVLDDTGFAQLGCFGSDMATPHMDTLAADGLRFNRFHVTSLCSPTRASLLTGRNHHAVGMGFLVDIPMSYPGYTARIPANSAPLPRVLRTAGYNTMAVGKWHLVPRGERTPAGPFDRWPMGFGFERYYGFLHGDANHWTPNLVSDNHYVDPPARPEDGYHLSEDLADQAIRMVLDQKHAARTKPFFLYWALGAMHAPHHVAPEWVAPYSGAFDDGWDRWRERTFARQVATGIVPDGTTLTERPPWITAWDDLPADQQRMHAREQEVFAGFLTHTDAQIGRFLDFLAAIGEADNTVVVLMSDNGASAEGGQFGTNNEHRFTARRHESAAANIADLDGWGGFRSYNHYSWGWAWAGNTPLRLWKRYTWLGGTRTPLVIRWPGAISDPGAVRQQFCHAVDLMPTILDACGLDRPAVVDGVQQAAMDGASLMPVLRDPGAQAPRSTQYFEMMGSRSIIHDGWKATTDHVTEGVVDEEELMAGSRDFATDHWALFPMTDFSEAVDVSADHPDVVRDLEATWWAEAGRNDVLPLTRGFLDRIRALQMPDYPPESSRVFYPEFVPDTAVIDEALPFLVNGFSLDVEASSEAPNGVLVALGDWNGGMALYVADGKLVFAACPAGDLVRLASDAPVPAGQHVLGVRCRRGQGHDVEVSLTCDDRTIGTTTAALAFPFTFQHGGARLRIGHDSGFPVTEDYRPPYPWSGTIRRVLVDGSPPPTVSVQDVAATLHAE